MEQKRVNRRYPPEFITEAVALVTDQGYSVPEAAKSLGIQANLIYRWKQQLEDQQQGNALEAGERDELKRLRKEVKNLRMEKEILKQDVADYIRYYNTDRLRSANGSLSPINYELTKIKVSGWT